MRELAHLAARLYGVPLMLLPSAADIFGRTFQQLLEHRGPAGDFAPAADAEQLLKPHGFAANIRTERYADKPYVVTDDGVGVLGIYGPLLQRFALDLNTCTAFASYQVIKRRMEMMFADPDVKGVLLEFDSPGGEVAGNFELAKQLLAARGDKPVWAHANEGAYSAAYSLASSAERILVPQAGSVGSIGVVMVHVDQSKRDEKLGVAFTFIYAGERKVDFNSHAPLGKKAMELATAEVVRLYDMFTGHVASARSMDVQAVRDTEAGVFPANEAKSLGLIDDVASFDEALAELTELVNRQPGTSFTTAGGVGFQRNMKGAEMSQANGAAPTTPAATPPTPAAGVPEAEVAQREATAAATARTEERKRIGAIFALPEAQGRTKLATTLALETDMTVEAAGKLLAAAAKEEAAPAAAAPAASPLAAAMQTVPNPPVTPGASGSAAGGGDDSPEALAANVLALRGRFQKGTAQ